MGVAMAKEYGGSFGNESLAKAERAEVDLPATLRPGAVLAGYQRPNRGDPREAELRVQAKLKQPTTLELARSDEVRRSALSSDERKAQAATLSVAMAQPHRRIGPDPRHPWLESPLGRFCLRMWPKDGDQRHHCYHAGWDYHKAVRDARRARGEHVDGIVSEGGGSSGSDDPTPADIAAQKLVIAAADAIVARANEVLTPVERRLPRAMEKLCCGNSDPSPYDEGILEAGLRRLAVHFENRDDGA